MKINDLFLSIRKSPVNFALMLLAFSLPFGGTYHSWFLLLSIFILVIQFVSGKVSFQFSKPQNFPFQALLYILLLLSIFIHPHFEMGFQEIGVKTTLLLFPILFSLSSIRINKILILNSFLAGCIVASLACLSFSFYDYTVNKFEFGVFFYGNLSRFIHPGYFAMYLAFAFYILLFQFSFRHKIIYTVLSFLLIIFIVLMIVLLSSRTNLISLFVVGNAVLLLAGFRKLKLPGRLILFFGIIVLVISAGWFLRNKEWNRFKAINNFYSEASVDPLSIESVDARVMVWKSSVEVIKQNFWIGVGSDNVNATLKVQYLKNGFGGIAEENLNAHNQYFQSFIAIGIFGFITLLLCIFARLPKAIRQKDFLLLSFIFIVAINFLTESMLERQAGVVFFAFFNSLFIFSNPKSENPK